MIKRLKRNFIIVTMISVVSVLTVLMGVVNAINYFSQDSEAAELLEILSENNGNFPEFGINPQDGRQGGLTDSSGRPFPPVKPSGEGGTDNPPPDKPEGSQSDRDTFSPGSDRGFMSEKRERRNRILTEETPYEQRYFTVLLGSDCQTENINTDKIAAVTSQEAEEMAKKLYNAGKTSGYTGNYKYISKSIEEGTLYIFLDRTRSLRSVQDFLMISLAVSLGAAAAIFVLVFIFSGFAIKPMAESYEKQKKFITNAGHELKTPLAVIDSCAEVMELEGGENKWTQGIRTQVERLTGLTQNLVALSRMDEGASQLKSEEFSFTDTVYEVVEPFSMVAEHNGIKFEMDIEENVEFKGDPDAIAQLCSIMADNAVKYTPENGFIRFTLSKKGRHITFSSENTAENIQKGSHAELFDRFHRGDSSHSSEKPGYGIGLSMLQSIAQAHSGKADAYSRDGNTLVISVKF